MALIDDRVAPLQALRLFRPGQGQPGLTQRRLGYWDPLQASFGYGTPSVNAAGQRLVELLQPDNDHAVLTCAGFPVLQDTRLTDYTTAGAEWEEQRPSTGVPRKYRLVWYDTSPDVEHSARSNFNLPANPSFWISLAIPDTPPDHDAATYPPYNRFEFGGGWAIQTSKVYGTHLLRYLSGAWRAVAEVPEPQAPRDVDEVAVVVRWHRGGLFISTDGMRRYEYYPTGPLGAFPLTFRGIGGMAVYGLHQLRYYAGEWVSQRRYLGESPLGTPVVSVPPWAGLEPAGTNLAVVDNSSLSSGHAGYTATLTPYVVSATPFDFYSSPELYAVRWNQPAQTGLVLGGSDRPWEESVYGIKITKTADLTQSGADVTIRKDPQTVFTWAGARFPRLEISGGHHNEAGAAVVSAGPIFTGYALEPETSTETYNAAEVRFRMESTAFHLRRAKWSPFERLPLGGQSLNAALDEILATEGIPATGQYRVWHAAGDAFPLDTGSPEDPWEWPKDGECKLDTMLRLCGYAGLELGVADDGAFFTLPLDFFRPWSGKILHAAPPDGAALTSLIQQARYTLACRESATMVIVTGESETGVRLVATAPDREAERNPLSPRFVPWREVVQEEVSGACTIGMLGARAAALAQELFRLKFEPTLTVPLDLNIQRRDRLQVWGLGHLGIANSDYFGVLDVEHVLAPTLGESSTTLGLRRLN